MPFASFHRMNLRTNPRKKNLKKEMTAIAAEIKAKTPYSILFTKITSVFIKKVRNSKTPSAIIKPFGLETTFQLWATPFQLRETPFEMAAGAS